MIGLAGRGEVRSVAYRAGGRAIAGSGHIRARNATASSSAYLQA